jgi:uncharacterized protein (TIGR02145 family)
MKRTLLFFACASILFSCELENGNLTTINREISSQYLLNGNLDVYLTNNQIFRYKGKPGIVTIPIGTSDLSKYEDCFVLHIATGTTTATIVSSAILKLDGLDVLNTSDFSKNAVQYSFEVCNLTQESVLTVEVRGEPGSYLDIWIEGKLKGLTVTDCDGNIYKTVAIGNQIWMKENLKTTKYNDCTPIPYVTDNSEWSILASPGFCYYHNEESTYKDRYGALYNFYTVNTNKLCPSGWHVSTKSDFEQMTNYLGGNEIAYSKLIEGGSSGFDASLGGLRDYPSNFDGIGIVSLFWLSGERWYVSLTSSTQLIDWWYPFSEISSNRAFSVRCIKD